MKSRSKHLVMLLACALGCGRVATEGVDDVSADAASGDRDTSPDSSDDDVSFGGANGGGSDSAAALDSRSGVSASGAEPMGDDGGGGGSGSREGGGPECRTSADCLTDGGLDSTTSSDATASTDESSPDSGSAVAEACRGTDAGLPAYASPASGTLSGSGVDATFCTSAYVQLFSVLDGPPAHLILNAFNTTSVDLTSPPDGSDPSLFVNIGIGAAAPGVYASTAPMSCGDISFIFDLPVPAGVDCSTATAPDCSPGCWAACTAPGDCGPCAPVAPGMVYEASVAQDCIDGTPQAVAGSWTVTLTSIEPYPKSASTGFETYYVVHGGISGSLTGDTDAGAQTAAFSLFF